MRQISSSLSFIFYGLSGILVNVQSIWWSQYQVYIVVQIIFVTAVLILTFFLVKTPFYLFKKRRIHQLVKSLETIASYNFKGNEKLKVINDMKKALKYDLYKQVVSIKDDHNKSVLESQCYRSMGSKLVLFLSRLCI